MAISIDNARTHEQLEELLEERSRALDSAEAQIRSLFDNSPLGIALSSLDGQILTVNNALLNMLRISEEELLQQVATDFYAAPADRKTMLAKLQESGTVNEFGVQIVRHDGTTFFGSINMSQLLLEGNEVLLVMVEDVTDKITAEQQAAVLEERERLARELHDAVTQTIFSANVIAEAAPSVWDKDPAIGRDYLAQLPKILRGALAEMRTLLLELRPDILQEQTLGQLLELLAEAARARSAAVVTLKVEGDCPLPGDVTLALHRIAQEALNNVAKHAEARELNIRIICNPDRVVLHVADDGRSFDPKNIPPGHLGIGIMRERAQEVGATFQIDSKPGEGTLVVVSWSAANGRKIEGSL